MKITEVVHIFGTVYSVVKFMPEFRQKNELGYIWATFSKTHLVTLEGHLFARHLISGIFQEIKIFFPLLLAGNDFG
jgi:hypothetical protein